MALKTKLTRILLFLFFIITIINALKDTTCSVETLNGCTKCVTASDSILFNNSTALFTCRPIANCLIINSLNQCIQCQTNYVNITGTCYIKNIPNCATYYLDASSAVKCSKCSQSFMDPTLSCAVSSTYCSSFNSTTVQCSACPTGKYLDASKKFCIQQIDNCLTSTFSGCIQCDQQYILNSADPFICDFSPLINYQLTFTTGKIVTCLQTNYYFSASKCILSTSVAKINVPYCMVDDGSSSCTNCIAGYFLLNKTSCNSCQIEISNCLICEPCSTITTTCRATCSICQPTHFIFQQSSTNQQICRQCTIYGCKKCQSTSSETVQCLLCERGQTLYNNTCYSCDQGMQLNLTSLQCQSCPTNCANCTNNICTWCMHNYAFDPLQTDNTKVCKLISTLTSITSSVTVYQILSKSFPNQQKLIYNDQIQLMSSCQGSATKYTCLCSQNSTIISSLCYNLTDVKKLDISKVFTSPIKADVYLKNSQALRLMSQLPAFDNLTFIIESNSTVQAYFPQNKIASLIEIYTQILRRQYLALQSVSLNGNRRLLMTTQQTLKQFFNLISASLSQTLSATQTTIIYGNGYYVKYYPKGDNITDTDSTFLSVSGRNTTQFLFIFVWFENLNSSKSLTGTIYAYSPLITHQITLTIQQIAFPLSTISYTLYKNLGIQSAQIQTLSSNTLTFSLSTSTPDTPYGYNVQYQQSSINDINSLYSSERIQFIFYQAAFIYVLVFLLAYLFLIPCCSLLDFISPKHAQRRKRVRSEDLSLNQDGKPKQTSQSSEQSQIQISINYKDFFPIYNICNTPRPKRILKLSLFLLNMQHGITFLTLIYFNLQPGHPVVAVVLGVPAYFCTIIMGYICGVLTLVIPGYFKYLINLIVLGYWILWIALMPRFKSQEYQPYVYIFAIVFFAIDLVIDSLEMFMVYFSIIKSQKQTKMFECLAAWLSKRGYFEYDQLAHEINGDDN